MTVDLPAAVVPVVVIVTAIGVGAAGLADRPSPRRPWRDVDAAGRRMVPVVVMVAAGLAVAGPTLTAVVVAVVVLGRWWRGRRAEARAAQQTATATVDLIELVALSLRGGTGALSVFDDVRADVPPVLGEPVDAVTRSLNDGVPMSRALAPLRQAGGRRAEALCDLLTRGLSDGVELAEPALALARRARDDERRRLDAQARRLPVLLLAPTFLCLVPAFVLLVVVPMLIVGVRAVSAI